MTDSGVTVNFSHEREMPSIFSDVFAQIESRFNFNHSLTGIHDPRARVAALAIADTGMDAAREFFRSLITRRNTLLPIFVLPTEILARVFHFLVREEPPLSGTRNLGWIGVTHVCQHWRQVALDNSLLWAKIQIRGIPKNTKWISEMLARARNASLDIEFNFLLRSDLEALHMTPPRLSRTRRLRIHNLSIHPSDGVCVREIFSWEAPALEHFELTSTHKFAISFRDLDRNVLFKGHAPRLRTFSLSKVVIPWSLIPRGQLTQLKIVRPHEGVDYLGELKQLIDLLVNCPALELLALDSCLPSQLAEFSHGQTIHLPRLSRLRLWGSTSRVLNMLKMLKLPSSTTLRLKCISDMATFHDDPEGLLLPLISAQFQSPGPVEFKSLTVTIQGSRTPSLHITASTNRKTQNFDDDLVDDPELVLSFDGLHNSYHSTILLEQACKSLPISNIEFISISSCDKIDVIWVELFSCCTNVITVRAIGEGASSFVHAFTASTATNAKSSKSGRKRKHHNRESTLAQLASTAAHAHAAVFPKLMSLGLSDLEFVDSDRFDCYDPDSDSGFLFDVFEIGLQQHMAASGAPLKLLCITESLISAKQVNVLERLVQKFHCDEDEASIDGFDDLNDYEKLFFEEDEILRDWDSDGWDTANYESVWM